MSEQKPEYDPTGKKPSDPGAKLDAGKNQVWMMLESFALALEQVAWVSTHGAEKYSRMGWVQVPDAKNRYLDAMGRHLLKIAQGQDIDEKSGLNHFAHVAWNVLAVLELELRAKKKTSGKKTVVYPVMDM